MKIFLIEDEPAIRTELARLLQKYGYDCEAGGDFARIADQALASGAGLVLLDINLPVQDGFQVCRQIRRQSDVPILVLTSRSTDFDELMSLNLGADDFVAKPYNPQCFWRASNGCWPAPAPPPLPRGAGAWRPWCWTWPGPRCAAAAKRSS